MPTEYEITVEIGEGSSLVNMTGDQIVAALEAQPTTPTDKRLDASAIKNLPSVSGYSTPSQVRDALQTLTGTNRLAGSAVKDVLHDGAEAKAALEALSGTNRLNATAIYDLKKSLVSGCERALNWRATIDFGNTGSVNASVTSVKKGDFWIANMLSGTPAPYPGGGLADALTHLISTGDWIIAVVDSASTSNFYSKSNWLIMPFSLLATIATLNTNTVFTQYNTTYEDGGIEIPGVTTAEGQEAFAINETTQAKARASHASGYGSIAKRQGEHSEAGTFFENMGDAQHTRTLMAIQTNDNTGNEVVSPQKYELSVAKCYDCTISVVAIQETGNGKKFTIPVLASITSDGTIAKTVGTATTQDIGTPSTDLDFEADVVYDSGLDKFYLQMTATGDNSEITNFHVKIDTLEQPIPYVET